METKIIIRLVSLLMMCLYCQDTTNAQHIENTRTMLEPKPEDCKPHPTYVSWHRVREYLQKYYKMDIPASVTGPPLKVMRCQKSLAPCQHEFTFCGVQGDRIIKGIVPLTVDGRNHKFKLILEYYEDKTCRCVRKSVYNHYVVQDVSAPPYITEASMEETSENTV